MEKHCTAVLLLAISLLFCFESVIVASDNEENSEIVINIPHCDKCKEEQEWRKFYNRGPSPIPDVSEECQQVLRNFSDSAATFTRCLAMNARPVTICIQCIEEYMDIHYWFTNISSRSGASCDTELMNRDHLQVVQTLARQAESYWSAGQCPNCYESGEDGIPKVCNDTIEFFAQLDQVHTCINNTEASVHEDLQSKNQSEVCDQCRQLYLELNLKYDELNLKYSNRLCMDLMDAMNITRHLWSKTYKCTNQNVESLPIILSSIGFLCMPVVFYFGNRFVASAKDTKLVPQKRMSFVQSSYSSTSIQR